MKTIFAITACSIISFCTPTFAQISAGVGHQLKEASPDSSGASQGSTTENPNGMSEGRAAAPNSPEAEGQRLDWKGKSDSSGASHDEGRATEPTK